MGKSGMQPQGKVKINWSGNFAYAIGLLVTDGNLSRILGKISFVSKDKDQVINLKNALGLRNKIGRHHSGTTSKKSFHVQFGDILFYNFLLSIGLTPDKSKTIGAIAVPERYFADFLRGYFDGDGCFYFYWDPRWKSSFMIYIELASASVTNITWLQSRILGLFAIKGRITKSENNSCFRLKFAKVASLKLLKRLYPDEGVISLARKRLKINQALAILNRQ